MAIDFTPEEIAAAGRRVLLTELQARSVVRFRDTHKEFIRLLGLMDSPAGHPPDWDQRLQDLTKELRNRYAKIIEVRAASKA